MTSEEYKELKSRIDTQKAKLMEAEAEKRTIEKQWKQNNINSLKEAEAAVDTLQEEIQTLEIKEAKLVNKIEEMIGDPDDESG